MTTPNEADGPVVWCERCGRVGRRRHRRGILACRFCEPEGMPDPVAQILELEAKLTLGEKRRLTNRRKEIATARRRPYFRQRYIDSVLGSLHQGET